jgi:hypothetical protein
VAFEAEITTTERREKKVFENEEFIIAGVFIFKQVNIGEALFRTSDSGNLAYPPNNCLKTEFGPTCGKGTGGERKAVSHHSIRRISNVFPPNLKFSGLEIE